MIAMPDWSLFLIVISALFCLVSFMFWFGSICRRFDVANNVTFTTLQGFLLFFSFVFSSITIWKMIPLPTWSKICIFLLFGAAFLWVVFVFAKFLGFFKIVKNSWCSVVITMLIFVVIPLASNLTHNAHEKEYLLSYPPDDQISVEITYDIKRVKSTGSIGHEWTYQHFINGQEFENGETVSVNAKSLFSITSRFIEHDDINDIGETTSKQYRYSQNKTYQKTLTISQDVHVVEEGGKRYAGSTADFNVVYTLKRVIPSSMDFWDIFFYSSSNTTDFVCILLIVMQTLSAIFIVFVLVYGKKKSDLYEY